MIYIIYYTFKLIVDDVSSTIDSTTDGSTLKKRKLPLNATSGSQNGVINMK